MRFASRFLAVAVLGSVLLSIGFSCSKTTTKHKPVEYRLYVGVLEPPGRTEIFVIDTETDSIIDSVEYPASNVLITASPDGEYFAAFGSGYCTRIYDTQGLTVLAELSCQQHAAFTPDIGQILGFHGSGVDFYNYSTFELEDQDTVWMGSPQVNTRNGIVYGLRSHTEGALDSTGFVAYDYTQHELVKSWQAFSGRDGESRYVIKRFHVHPDGNRVYGTSITRSAVSMFCYDLWGDSAVFENSIAHPCGAVRVSPDGREVYLTDPGFALGGYTPGKIFVYDADNGRLLDEISLQGLDTITAPLPRHLFGAEIRFHPKKPKVYVSCGGHNHLGPILVIDTETRKIVKWLFPNFDHSPQFMDIAPKL